MERTIRKPDRAYWLCQAGGWGLYTLYVLSFSLQLEQGPHLKSIISVVGFLFVVSPMAAHGLRWWILRHGWLDMSAARVIPRAILAVVLISEGLSLTTGLFNVLILRNGGWTIWFPNVMFAIASGYATAFFIWLWIYFSVQDRRRRRALELKTLKLEVVAHDARLRTLESQLNPHFLFNALNSVRALVVEDPPRAQTMITRLAELLRYSLRSGTGADRDTVALDEEIRAVEDYLAIERVRFEERITVTIDVEPAARRQRVPRMLVLTLVENAVKHGLSRLADGGAVTIAARIDGDRLRVRVANSGSLRTDNRPEGLGLSNARERLQLLYGDAAGLTLESEPGVVVASVSTPLLAHATEREALAERHV